MSVSSYNKKNFLSSVESFFNSPAISANIIYYSGHGYKNTDLLFETGEGDYMVNYEDILTLCRRRKNKKRNKFLLIILDCCYSSTWIDSLFYNADYKDVIIQTSSTRDKRSWD